MNENQLAEYSEWVAENRVVMSFVKDYFRDRWLEGLNFLG